MKFHGLNGIIEDQDYEKDYSGGKEISKVTLGEFGVYFKDGLKKRFVAYSEIDRYFKRLQEVNGRMCCGNATFSYYKLVIIHESKEIIAMMTEDEKVIDDIIAEIQATHPELAYGYIKNE